MKLRISPFLASRRPFDYADFMWVKKSPPEKPENTSSFARLIDREFEMRKIKRQNDVD